MANKLVGFICFSVAMSWIVGWFGDALGASVNPGGQSPAIWIVFFNSHNCSQCEGVGALIDGLKEKHHIGVKSFDVEDERNYSLFKKIEAIHGCEKFSVPLVIVGEHILIGPETIENRLEPIVAGLNGTGAALPYLGPQTAAKLKTPHEYTKAIARTAKEDCHCNQGQPPQITDEFRKIRSLLDRWF